MVGAQHNQNFHSEYVDIESRSLTIELSHKSKILPVGVNKLRNKLLGPQGLNTVDTNKIWDHRNVIHNPKRLYVYGWY